jgi:hypothetical protein
MAVWRWGDNVRSTAFVFLPPTGSRDNAKNDKSAKCACVRSFFIDHSLSLFTFILSFFFSSSFFFVFFYGARRTISCQKRRQIQKLISDPHVMRLHTTNFAFSPFFAFSREPLAMGSPKTPARKRPIPLGLHHVSYVRSISTKIKRGNSRRSSALRKRQTGKGPCCYQGRKRCSGNFYSF